MPIANICALEDTCLAQRVMYMSQYGVNEHLWNRHLGAVPGGCGLPEISGAWIVVKLR